MPLIFFSIFELVLMATVIYFCAGSQGNPFGNKFEQQQQPQLLDTLKAFYASVNGMYTFTLRFHSILQFIDDTIPGSKPRSVRVNVVMILKI